MSFPSLIPSQSECVPNTASHNTESNGHNPPGHMGSHDLTQTTSTSSRTLEEISSYGDDKPAVSHAPTIRRVDTPRRKAPLKEQTSYKKTADWAKAQLTVATKDLKEAQVALAWAHKNNSPHLEQLSQWAKTAASRHYEAAKYASLTELRFRLGGNEISFLPEGAENYKIHEWINKWDPRWSSEIDNPHSTHYDNPDNKLQFFLQLKQEHHLDQKWSLDQIQADLETAKTASWAQEDPQHTAVKILAHACAEYVKYQEPLKRLREEAVRLNKTALLSQEKYDQHLTTEYSGTSSKQVLKRDIYSRESLQRAEEQSYNDARNADAALKAYEQAIEQATLTKRNFEILVSGGVISQLQPEGTNIIPFTPHSS